MFNVFELFFSLGPGDYINIYLSGSFIVYSVKLNASVLLMFVLSLGSGDYTNMSLSGPAIVLAVTIDAQHYTISFLLEGLGITLICLSSPQSLHTLIFFIRNLLYKKLVLNF